MKKTIRTTLILAIAAFAAPLLAGSQGVLADNCVNCPCVTQGVEKCGDPTCKCTSGQEVSPCDCQAEVVTTKPS